MRILTTILALMASAGVALAGDGDTKTTFIDKSDMELQLRGSFGMRLPEGGKATSGFRMDNFRMNIEGTAGKDIHYRFRQNFASSFEHNTLENLVESINYAYITYKPFNTVSFTAGKNVFALGGHEFWAAPVNVIEFSDFGSSLSAYQLGVSVNWDITENQELILQMSNINGVGDDKRYFGGLPEGVSSSGAPFLYTLDWNGAFGEDGTLELRYSASYGQQAKGHDISILTLGNSYKRRTWGAYLDLAYSRQGLDASGLISEYAKFGDARPRTLRNTEYFSAVAYVHFFVSPSFQAFLKGVGETGGLYKDDGNVSRGLYRHNWNAQACLQYMPTKDSDFRIFAHYSYYNRQATSLGREIGLTAVSRHAITAGIIYIMRIF